MTIAQSGSVLEGRLTPALIARLKVLAEAPRLYPTSRQITQLERMGLAAPTGRKVGRQREYAVTEAGSALIARAKATPA